MAGLKVERWGPFLEILGKGRYLIGYSDSGSYLEIRKGDDIALIPANRPELLDAVRMFFGDEFVAPSRGYEWKTISAPDPILLIDDPLLESKVRELESILPSYVRDFAHFGAWRYLYELARGYPPEEAARRSLDSMLHWLETVGHWEAVRDVIAAKHGVPESDRWKERSLGRLKQILSIAESAGLPWQAMLQVYSDYPDFVRWAIENYGQYSTEELKQIVQSGEVKPAEERLFRPIYVKEIMLPKVNIPVRVEIGDVPSRVSLGAYIPESNTIRISVKAIERGYLEPVVAHELGHALSTWWGFEPGKREDIAEALESWVAGDIPFLLERYLERRGLNENDFWQMVRSVAEAVKELYGKLKTEFSAHG